MESSYDCSRLFFKETVSFTLMRNASLLPESYQVPVYLGFDLNLYELKSKLKARTGMQHCC